MQGIVILLWESVHHLEAISVENLEIIWEVEKQELWESDSLWLDAYLPISQCFFKILH